MNNELVLKAIKENDKIIMSGKSMNSKKFKDNLKIILAWSNK